MQDVRLTPPGEARGIVADKTYGSEVVRPEPFPAGAYRAAPDGVELFCRLWEPEKPVAVLLALHDLGGHGEWFESLAGGLLPRSVAILAPDQRGHGLSRWDLGRLPTPEVLLRDARFCREQAMAHYPGLPFFLLGTGLGGALAILAAGKDSAATGLILLSPTLRDTDLNWAEKGAMALSLLVGREGGAPTPLGRGLPLCTDPLRMQWLRKDPLALTWLPARTYWRAHSLMRRARRALSDVRLPVLCLQGAHDPVVNPGGTARIFERRGGTRFVLWEEGAHDLALEPSIGPLVGVMTDWIRHQLAQSSEQSTTSVT